MAPRGLAREENSQPKMTPGMTLECRTSEDQLRDGLT